MLADLAAGDIRMKGKLYRSSAEHSKRATYQSHVAHDYIGRIFPQGDADGHYNTARNSVSSSAQ